MFDALFHFLLQGVTHQQWYLFNDFLIEPIDKVTITTQVAGEVPRSPSYQRVHAASLSQTEAAQFDVSWKVPAILYYAKRNYHTRYDLRSRSSPVRTVSFPTRYPLMPPPLRLS